LVSFILSLIFPLLIFLMLSPLIDRAMVNESTVESVRIAEYLSGHLGLNGKNLAPGGRDEWIAAEVSHINRSFGLSEICVIAGDGRVAYSSEEGRIGRKIQGGLIKSLLEKGQGYNAFKQPGEVSLEGFPIENHVIETYVPVRDGQRVVGGISVFYDISSVLDELGFMKKLFAAVLFIISFGAMIMVSIYLVGAERGKQKRERVEEALIQEQLKAETVFSSLGDNIIIQDRDYRIIYQNAINRDVYGDRKGEFCYKAYEGLDNICPDCPVELTYKDGGIHKTEKEVNTPNGMAYFELTASPLRNSSGDIVAGIKVVRDITEKRKLEEQLRHVQKMEAIGTLTSGISHEFNNLLSSIIGFSEMQLDLEPGDERSRQYTEAIYQSGKRAEALTRGLLAYSRKQIANKNILSINGIIRDIENLMQNVIGSNISMRLDLSEKDLIVHADRNQIEQVLVNIITNARDAMPEGGTLTISTSAVNGDREFVQKHGFGADGEKYCLISIKDTGSGMDAATLDKMFEPFFTTKDVGTGTGLGLSIVYGIVSQHGGVVDVISSPGEGTEFRVYLS